MWAWILAIVLVTIGYVIYSIVMRILSKRIALKSPTSDTPLYEFKESHATDSRLAAGALKVIENISERFERMCILDPLTYQGDPSLPTVIEQYKKLLSGKIKDPEGRHMPSEYLNGHRNPDYETYIAAQKRVLGRAGCRETLRLKRVNQEEDLRTDFTVKLVEMKFPIEVLDAVLSDEKMNAYSADDWKKLTKAVKGYLEDDEYSAEVVSEFLNQFNEIKILCDSDKMEAFSVFYKFSAPMNIVTEIIRDRISLEQGVRITQLVVDQRYPWDEAMEEVLEEDMDKATEADLKKKYRQLLKI
jgi:hypothetical protein